MITVSTKEPNNVVTCSDKEIVLSGKPKLLKGYIQFENNSNESVFIQDLPLKKTTLSIQSSFPRESIVLNAFLNPQDSRSHFTSVSLDPTTPPGTYTTNMVVGNKSRVLKMIVQENLECKLMPARLTFSGIAPGKTHQKEILIKNNGNMPFTIPNIKHNTMVDMDLVCRNLSQAFRENMENGTEATLDSFVKGIKKDLTGWVNVNIKEAGQTVAPGDSMVINFSITLPEDVNKQRFYEGDVRFLDKKIKYKISSDEPNIKPKPLKSDKNKKDEK